MKLVYGVLLAVLVGGGDAEAASFDCGKAHSRVEKLICATEQLGDLDEKLDAAFVAAKKVLAPGEVKAFTQEQIQWLQKLRNSCNDKACLERVYTTRLNELDPFADHQVTCDEMRHKPALVFNPDVDLGSGSGSPTDVDYRCPDSLSELIFMKSLLDLTEEIRGDAGPQVCTGTIVYAQRRYFLFDMAQAGLAPRTMKSWNSQPGPADWKTYIQQDATGTTAYFRQWSEQSLRNQSLYEKFAQAFDQAAAQLTGRYTQQFGMSAAEAQSAAKVALSALVQRAAGSAPKSAVLQEFALLQQLRTAFLKPSQVVAALPKLTQQQRLQALKLALLNKQSSEVVAALADSLDPQLLRGTGTPSNPDVPDDEADVESAPEPLLSLALGNLANLEYLLRKQVPVDAANGFGKTPLFYAIGSSNHAAVDMLLQHHADVGHAYTSKQSLRSDEQECVFPALLHTGRTTLMHAAQNSDVQMLKILLKSGAALRTRDDLGFNAHDYALMGNNGENARYLASLGLQPSAPRYSSEAAPSVREQKLVATIELDGYVNKLLIAPQRPDLLVASVLAQGKSGGRAQGGLYFISIAEPLRPLVLGMVPAVQASDMAISPDGKLLYYIDSPAQKSTPAKKRGLNLVNIANPSKPSQPTVVEGDFMTMHLSTDGGLLYLQERNLSGSQSRGSLVFKTGATVPRLLCSNPFGKTMYERPVFAYGFASFPDEPLLAIADQLNRFLLFDVRDPCAPQKLVDVKSDMNPMFSAGKGRTWVVAGLTRYKLDRFPKIEANYFADSVGSFHVNPATGLTTAVFDKDLVVLHDRPDGSFVLSDRFRSPAENLGAVLSIASGHIYMGWQGGLGAGVVPLSSAP